MYQGSRRNHGCLLVVLTVISLAAMGCRDESKREGTPSVTNAPSDAPRPLLDDRPMMVEGAPIGPAWASTGAMHTARQDLVAVLLANGSVLVAGGQSGGTATAAAETYSPTAKTWTTSASMHTARYDFAGCMLTSGKILVAGGWNNGINNETPTAELYNPSNNTWSTTGSLATARQDHQMTCLSDGRALVTGGYQGLTTLSSSEIYNPTAGTWSSAGTIPFATHAHRSAVMTDGRVLLVGGTNPNGAQTSTAIWNPTSGAWSSTGSMATARAWHAVSLLSDGRVLAAGGLNGSLAANLTAEIYTPSSGTWSAAASLHVARYSTAVATLTAGPIVVGGTNGTSAQASSESYDNVHNAWSMLTMPVAAVDLTATALTPATVLVAGGNTGSAATTSAQVYGICANSGAVNGTACDDGNACTQGETCQSGVCSGGSPVTCTASDQCHTAGTCNASTGACSNPVAANGTTCSDGNACTQGDSCQSGTCTSGTPVTCSASDQCHTAGTCNTSTGACSNPTAANGTTCNDGNACTQSDTCQSGTCTGGTSVTCTASDQCHTAGTCNTSTGVCSNPVATNGTACSDGNACTQGDTCQSGACASGSPVVCTASDQCHAAGTCDPGSGTCSNPAATNGTTCSDGNACTQNDTCQSGTCTGGSAVTCTASDQCHTAGTCNASTGVCSNPAATNGTACSDGNACTQGDTCQSGACASGSAVTCTASDQCHAAGTCDPSSGACSNPAAADGTACNDGNACTQTDTCSSGACTGSNPVTCVASDQCHTQGTCDPSSGTCSNPTVADGTGCSDGNACTQTDACQSGACVGSNPVVCTASDSCHQVGTCDPTAGTCSNPTVPDGTACSAGNVCTGGDTCSSGTCTQGPPVSIDDGNACTLDTCDPTNGVVHHACSTIDRTVSTALFTADSFIFSGSDPVQTGVASGTIVPATMAVVRGQVMSKSGSALSGVTVSVVNHPEFGSTLSQGDGSFDMAVNGGQTLRLHYALTNYLPAERLIQAPWQDYVTASDVVLLQVDSQVTAVDLSSSGDVQIARGTPSTDSAGTRQATLIVPPDTQGTMTMPDGSTAPLTAMHVRATEYSVGTNGPSAMPADLPPTAAYAYAVELTADEALSAGASTVTFSQPLPLYVEDFLGLPVGTIVPSGYYAPAKGAWLTSGNGIILQIVSVSGSEANIDVTGDGEADTGAALTALGVTDLELQTLADLYAVGQKLWRTPVGHFTGFSGGPDNGAAPGTPDVPTACSVQADVQPSEDFCGQPSFCGAGQTRCSCTGNPAQPQAAQVCNYSCCPPGYGEGDNEICGYIEPTPPCDSPSPPLPSPDGPGNCEKDHASSIECQQQSLGEDISLPGTGLTLHYASDRQRGHVAQVIVPFGTGSSAAVSMRVSVAGRVFTQALSTNNGSINTFTWDGHDAYGRLLQGSQPINIQLSYQYSSVYENAGSFGLQGSGTPITGGTTRLPFLIVKGWESTIESWDSQPEGLGGWTLNVHHAYDVTGRILRLGDGTNRTLRGVPAVIQTIAGNGASATNGDGGAATSASVSAPQSVAVGADGSVYIADGQSCIRKVGPDGTINTVAGLCNHPGFSGDGGPATSSQLQAPQDIALGPDGSLYIADTSNQRIRRVDLNGVIQTVAGSGPTGAGSFSGDGGPATSATLQNPTGIDVAADGTLYIADRDNGRIRQVSPGGVIATIAGSGLSSVASGTEGAATAASLGSPARVRVGPDGSLYIAETAGNVVRRVGSDGVIHPVAGTGTAGYTRDGYPSNPSMLNGPLDLAFGGDGSLYVVDQNFTVRQVTPRGILATVAGLNGKSGFSGDNGQATAATLGTSHGIRVGPDGSVYIASTADNRVRRVAPAFAPYSGSTGSFRIPSEDGRQIFVFDANGRHLQTLDALTGAAIYAFAYDGGGRLSSVADFDGNVTQFEHDASGNPTIIVSPYGQTTTLAADANGYLASVTDPASETTQFIYDGNGLLQTKIDARGGLSTYTYDTFGRLTADEDAADASTTLARTDNPNGPQVKLTTATGLQTTLETSETYPGAYGRINTLPSGYTSSLQQGPVSTTVTAPEGAQVLVTTPTPDPRPGFGMLSPVSSLTNTLPSGLSSTQATTRSATFAGANLATFTEQASLNGEAWTRLFNVATQTWTTTSPAGRTTSTVVDPVGRPTQITIPKVAPTVLTYDGHGRLSSMTQATRSWTTTYDANGYLASLTDPLTHVVSYTNDPVGRPTLTVLPDGRQLATSYDPAGSVTQVVLPSTDAHDFAFTPVELMESYTPPSVGSGSTSTTYAYDPDRKPTTVTRPDGATITYGYDSYGHLATTTYPQGTLKMSYDPGSDLLTSATSATGETTSFGYDGSLLKTTTWKGPVAGTLSLSFDNNFRMTSQTVGGTALAFGYDLDGLLTGAGALTVTRDAQNGRLTGSSLGSLTDSYGYDTNGLLASYTAAYNGTPLYAESVGRDAVGRITQKTETVQGTTHVWGYTFDAAGRLTDVTEDSNFFSHYGYDADDNRTTYTNAGGTVNPTYDAQDRLTAYGAATYGYTLDGELTSKTVSGQTTSYTYDALGNLLHVGPPTGSAIDYVVDGENRRVGKEVGGTLSEGFLYQDGLNVVAQLDGSGNLVGRYVFGSKPNVPDYFTTSAGTFRVLSDHLGSPRLVVNTSSGAVVEEIDYDEFGNVTNDTSPGLTPFGFAGGLYDKDTGLVRFGARDYDASVGRWTTKDPIRFKGGSFNLYGYVVNDPVNGIDPAGTKDLLICLQTVPYGDIAQLAACLLAPTGGNPYRIAPEDCDQVWNDTWDACIEGGGSWSDCLAKANKAEEDCRKRNNPSPNPTPDACLPAVPLPEPIPFPLAP